MDSLQALVGIRACEWPAVLAAASVAYLGLVRLLRYRRRDSLRHYGYQTRASYASMTIKDACEIHRQLMELEFPTMIYTSTFFALFKTYGIPTISKLLLATGELSCPATASKRAADTSVIMTEIELNEPGSDRRIDGIARMNFLHAPFRKSGKILDDDMLYTLGLFALEPCRWFERFEWRPLTALEKCALGVSWREVGEAMEIPFDALEPYYSGSERDGLAWIEALDAWSQDYENKCLVYAETNEKVAKATLDIVMYDVPLVARGFSLGLTSALLEPRTRKAMGLADPHRAHEVALSIIMALRKWTLRYLCLPRPSWMKLRRIGDPDPVTGRYHTMRYIAFPWYMKPSFASRWGGIDAMYTRFLGGILPGDGPDGGAKYCPGGYLIPELGPDRLKGKGETQMADIRKKLLMRCQE